MANEKDVVRETRVPKVSPNNPVESATPVSTAQKSDAKGHRQFDRNSKRPNRRPNEREKEYEENIVEIKRISKTVSGGRKMRFSALAVVGNRKGLVGFGTGKANEVPDAIKKAIEEAKKNLITVPIVGTTIPHEFVGRFGSASVILKPGAEGTGVIAGGSVRPVLELAGYKDIKTKVIGTNNPRNVVYATLEALKSMRTVEEVAKKRGKKVSDIM